jgi:hypothetical protein
MTTKLSGTRRKLKLGKFTSHIEKGEFPQAVDLFEDEVRDLKISGDGSKVFCLGRQSILAWSIWAGETVGEVQVDCWSPTSLAVDGSRVWTYYKELKSNGWDFGLPGSSSPIPLLNIHLERPHLEFTSGTKSYHGQSGIKDTVTGKDIFWLPERYLRPSATQWDGWYLVAGYGSGEVLILDFHHLCP